MASVGLNLWLGKASGEQAGYGGHKTNSTAGSGQAQLAFRWLSGLGEEGLMAMLPHKKEPQHLQTSGKIARPVVQSPRI